MDARFWRERWDKNEIGFHQGDVNALLIERFQTLSLAPNSRIFVPLCGKTNDIAWLLSEGHRVVGVELSDLAIEQLFESLGVDPDVSSVGPMRRYSAPNIDIFVGDFFDISSETLGEVHAIYDRAALVALPADMRGRYAERLSEITNGAPHLLICFEYDQTVMDGPPFSIDEQEIARLYDGRYAIQRLTERSVSGGLKGVCPAQEVIWLLR